MIRSFAYLKPCTMEDALKVLQCDNSEPMAGGTDLLVEMRSGLKKPDLVVDVKGIDELNVFSIDPERGLTIGAGITLNFLVDNKKIREYCSAISDAAFTIATYQIRNRAKNFQIHLFYELHINNLTLPLTALLITY